MSKKSLGGSSLYVILGLVFIAVIGLRTISTPEIWTHLALGQENAPISFIESDSFVNTTWLYDNLTYKFWTIGGAPLLIILNVIGLLLTFILLLQVSKKWGEGLSQGFALLICGHLIFQTVDVGPQVSMMLFIALFLYILNSQKSPAILFGTLIPLQILWTNMHSSFLYGPIIAGLTAVQVAQNSKASNSRKKNKAPQTGLLGILAVSLLAASLINPYFLKMHVQVFANIQSPLPAYWSSLFIEYFQIPALKPLILFTMVLGACGLITLKKKLPLVLTTLAIYSAFLVWTSPKTAMLFAAMAFPFIVLSLTSISEYLQTSFDSLLGKKAKFIAPVTGAVLVLLLIASIVPIVGNSAYVKTGSASVFGLGAQDNLYPNDLEALFNDPAFPEVAINLAADGGYLAFNYGRKCFIDYRPGTYSKEDLKNLSETMLGNRKAYDELFEKYRPEAFIINTLTPTSAQGIATLLNRGIWKLAYFDGTTAVLIQNKEKFAKIINNTELQQAGLAKLEEARATYAKLNGSSKLGNPAELIGSGKIYLAFNRPQEAKAIFSMLVQGSGTIPGAWIGLGSCQLMLKEFDEAVASLKIATQQAPNSFLAWANYAQACKYAGLSDEYEVAVDKAKKLAEQNAKAAEKIKVEEEVLAPVKTKSLEELSIP
ncbi:tetratricopeptide repeat protein [Pontiellaceae bacterium B12219]|nr:tetratricopeptide repeat protein [Pontiellaceae bacterium B12219]